MLRSKIRPLMPYFNSHDSGLIFSSEEQLPFLLMSVRILNAWQSCKLFMLVPSFICPNFQSIVKALFSLLLHTGRFKKGN